MIYYIIMYMVYKNTILPDNKFYRNTYHEL